MMSPIVSREVLAISTSDSSESATIMIDMNLVSEPRASAGRRISRSATTSSSNRNFPTSATATAMITRPIASSIVSSAPSPVQKPCALRQIVASSASSSGGSHFSASSRKALYAFSVSP